MPTYDYECTKCRHRFELFQRITESPRKRCPKCRCRVVRLFGTGAGLLFKGSGFYATDYRSDTYRKAAKADSSSAIPPAPTGGADSGVSKPAAPAVSPVSTKKEGGGAR